MITKQVRELKDYCEREMNLLTSTTACFTGHRPQKLPWGYNEDDNRCIEMKYKLEKEIIGAIHKGYNNFITGMALGFDMICAETILKIQKDYPFIKLIAALPCKNQYKYWNTSQILRYKKILSQCNYIRCLYENYNDKCMIDRNDFMINNSSLVIALYNGKVGGTSYTIKNAKLKNLDVIIISI